MIQCEIFVYSTSAHVSQLYTGFNLLAKHGIIKLKYNFKQYSRNGKTPLKHVIPNDLQGLFVVLNNEKTIFYDTTDGRLVIKEALEVADLYFKRSYRASEVPEGSEDKVLPLGLNFELYTKPFDGAEFSRFFLNRRNYTQSWKELLKCMARYMPISYNPTMSRMHFAPQKGQEPRVLFMVRAWNPGSPPRHMTAEEKAAWTSGRQAINETRATIIEKMRKEFGDRFYGGFSHTDFAAKNFRKLLVPDNSSSKKGSYINMLHNYPICIATTGLYESIGWKFAEYVAFSKAIVSEKLNFIVPGNFSAGVNYLEFETADECMEQTTKLFENDVLREQMMENNYKYYEEYLSPDKLILNTLNIALNSDKIVLGTL